MMTSPSPAASVTTPTRLDSSSVLAAAASLCAADRDAAARLANGLRRLVAGNSWAEQTEQLNSQGLAAQHIVAPLREVLEFPGDLALLREDNGFTLLSFSNQRWQHLTATGEALANCVTPSDDMVREAVMIRIPRSAGTSHGFASLAALWPKLRSAWAEVGVASLFLNAGQLLLPLFAMLIYDKIALNGLFETLWALVIGMALYLTTDTGMRLMRSWMTERISTDLARQGDETLWARLVTQVELPPGGFPRFLSNYRDLTLARDFVSSSYLLAIADIPFLLLYLGVVGTVSWPLMLVLIALVLVYSVVGLLLQRRQTRLSRLAEQQNTQKLTFMGEALNCLDVVRTTPGAGMFLRSWRTLADQSIRSDADRRLALQQSSMFTSAMQTVTSVVLLTCGVYLIYGQHLSTGGLIACNLLSGRAMALVASFFTVVVKWQDFIRSAERMEQSLEQSESHGTTPRPDIAGQYALIGVGKHYEGRPPALEEITLKINPGERIALLGKPGAGKSTLLRCLAGLCRPNVGQIQIDGLSLEDISRSDRNLWLAYKSQDPAIFAGTLEENLRISGCKDQERLQAALWTSGLDTEFSSGRLSLGMRLEERGSNLSGGQRQKVALARALAQPSRILLLDEPTLGLDPESERLLAARLPQLLDPTSVLIMTTHSPVMLQTTQRVIVLDGGKVVADGPRDRVVTLQTTATNRPASAVQAR